MAGPNLTRELQIKEILDRIQQGGDTQGAAADLERMFSRIESDAEKVKTGGDSDPKTGAPMDTAQQDVNVRIYSTYRSVTDAVKKVGEDTVATLGNVFGSYHKLLNTEMQATINTIPKLNVMMSKTGDNAFKTFNDFKGMSMMATKDMASMQSRVMGDLIKTMDPENAKKYLNEFYLATQKNFNRIKLLGPETEAQYVKLGAALKNYQIEATTSARYMQNLNILGDGPEKFASHFDQVQRIANQTNQPVAKLMEYYDNLRMKQGYNHRQAINNLAELSVRSMETGLSVDDLGSAFGKNMDSFSDLVPKIANLNSTFRLRLNPAAMTKMTAEQRQRYITNALKRSGVDLNNRLLQRQVSALLGDETKTRKFIASIANQNAEVQASVAKARNAVRAIAQNELSGTAATAKVIKDSKTMMDMFRQQELSEKEIAYRNQAMQSGRDAGLVRGKGAGVSAEETEEAFKKRLISFGVQRIEKEATATRELVHAFKETISAEFKEDKMFTQFMKTAVVRFQRAQAIIGGRAGTALGAVEALSGAAGDLGQGLAKQAVEKLGDENKGLIKEQKSIAAALESGKTASGEAIKKSDLAKMKLRKQEIDQQVRDLKAYIAAQKKLEADGGALAPSKAAIDALRAGKKKLEARTAKVDATGRETVTEQGKRWGKEAVSGAQQAWKGVEKTWKSTGSKIDSLVEAIKTAKPVVINLDGEKVADAVIQHWTDKNPKAAGGPG